jgi:DNA-directed RNA polymerase specialized sigma24 family protein
MRASHVTAHTARAVRDLDERLWNSQPPSATKAQRLASDAARAHAAQRGWRPRLAWDDIENDAEPNPDQPDSSNPDDLDEIAIERAIAGDTQVRLTDAEQREVVRQLTERGRSIRVIAELLATSKRTVSRRRRQISAA